MSENETKEVNTAPKGGDELIVEGYRFNSLADAAAAREEKKPLKIWQRILRSK